LLNEQSYTSGSSYGSSSSAPSVSQRRSDYWDKPKPPRSSPPPPHQETCDNPYDLQDLYYYISPKNGQGSYIPQQTNAAITEAARKTDRPSGFLFRWTHGIIPNTSATGCMSQDLGGYFGVQVDGLNKVIIDAYNATFLNGPPPVPLRPKYFYYIRSINISEEYLPRRLKSIHLDLKYKNVNLESDVGWGNPQKIPNTTATGFMATNDKKDRAETIYVRVDRANNAIIEAYNESLKKPLPPGWEELKEPSGRVYYGNPALKAVQYDRPQDNPAPTAAATPAAVAATPAAVAATPAAATPAVAPTKVAATPAAAPVATLPSTPLPPGWEILTEPSGRVYYGNPALRITQYAFPTAPQPTAPQPTAPQPTAPQPANVSAPLPPSKLPPSPLPDPDDSYYFISSEQGPYLPESEDNINISARAVAPGNTFIKWTPYVDWGPNNMPYAVKTVQDRESHIDWRQGSIPKTSATGWVSQNLNGHFAVRVDGVNKLIIDAYNAQFPNQPVPVKLKPKYFYYVVNNKNGIQTYTSATLNTLKYNLRSRHGFDYWGEQKQIFNTTATGFMIPEDTGIRFGLRVDKTNADTIMAYVQSISPLPPGWEQLREPSGVVYYKKDNVTQYERPPPPPLPSGWVRNMDTNQKFFYQNGAKWQYEYPLPTQPVAAATTPTTTQPTKVDATPAAATTPATTPVATQPCALQLGWNELKDPKSGRTYYGNPNSKTVQWERPCAPSVAVPAPSVAVAAPSVAVAAPSVAVAAPSVEYYYQVGDGDFPYEKVGSNNALNNAIASVCPKDNSKCHIALVRADSKEQQEIENYNTKIKNKPNGGGKKHRRTNRRTNRRNASRRTASHRSASRRTASRRKASRRKAYRRTGKK
jgi:hypothetical protein